MKQKYINLAAIFPLLNTSALSEAEQEKLVSEMLDRFSTEELLEMAWDSLWEWFIDKMSEYSEKVFKRERKEAEIKSEVEEKNLENSLLKVLQWIDSKQDDMSQSNK